MAAVDIANPQSWNRYGYVVNGPLVAIDLFGLECADGTTGGPQYGGAVNCPGYFPPTIGTISTTVTAQGPGGASGPSSPAASSWLGFIYGATGLPAFVHMPKNRQVDKTGLDRGDVPADKGQKRGFLSCTTSKDVALALTNTALDAIGTVPAVGNTFKAVQFGADIVGAGISVYGDMKGAGLSGAGLGLSLASNAGFTAATKVGKHGLEVIPVLGNVVAGISVVFDVADVVSSYSQCMERN